MQNVLKVILLDGSTILVNEDNICTVEYAGKLYKNTNEITDAAKIKMANGDVLTVISPTYPEWEADTFFSN